MSEFVLGVDLDVPAGSTTAVLGASGCGKTTLLRVVAGFMHLGDGEVRLDDEVIASLTTVRGIGRWTAEMQLIFLLDRPDVFPVADVGVRRGFERVLGLDEKASPDLMLERARLWAPYRSVASWYLWRAVDQTGESVPATSAAS